MGKEFLNKYPPQSRFDTFTLNFDPAKKRCRVLALHYHLERLFEKNKSLQSRFLDVNELYGFFKKELQSLDIKHRELLVRIVSTDTSVNIQIEKNEETFTNKAKCIFYSGQRIDPLFKMTPARESSQARAYARSRGFDEAIFVGTDGIIREGAWTSFFWFDGSGVLYSSNFPVLPGVTRRLIIEFAKKNFIPLKFVECSHIDLLNTMTEGFICNAIIGLVPIVLIEETRYSLTTEYERFSSHFEKFLEDKNEIFTL